jgi:two-component system, LytTR family, response regulator
MSQEHYTAIIVDDETLARQDLKLVLSKFPMIEVVGEAKNIHDAVEEIKNKNPDLIFLDIEFPGETGFDLLEKIDTRAKVIFVTAYDEFAIRAFEVNACDYLLKPVNPDRLALTFDRLKDVNKQGATKIGKFNRDDSIYIQLNYKYYFVRIDSIIKIEASDNYTEIVTTRGLKGLTNKHLNEWEECLPENLFLRIHRSTMVNLEYIEKIIRLDNLSSQVFLKNCPEPVVISRRYEKKFRKRLSGFSGK